jgi:hypothetical protein
MARSSLDAGGGDAMCTDSNQTIGDEDRLDKLIVPAIRHIVAGEGFYRCERDLHHHLTSSLEKIVPLRLGSQDRLVGYEHPTTAKYTWKAGGTQKKSGNVDFCFFDRSGADGSPKRNTALEINYDYRSETKVAIDCEKLADPRNEFRQGVYLAFGYRRNFKQSIVAGLAKAFAVLAKRSPGFRWPQALYVYLVEHDDGDNRRLWQGTPDPSQAVTGGLTWTVLCEHGIGTSHCSMLAGGDPDSLLTRSEAKGILEREFHKAGVSTDSKSARRVFEATKARDGTNRCRLGKTPLWDCEIRKVGDKVKRSVFAVWLRRILEDAVRSQNASIKGKSKK